MRVTVRALGLLALACMASASDVLPLFSEDHPANRKAALALARQAFDTYCLQRRTLSLPAGLPDALRLRSAVFVSSMVNGAPRCCMGSLYPTQPSLAREIIASACAAAAVDWRFAPIRPTELQRLQLIVSILAPPESITDPKALDPLVEGVAVRSAKTTGVALPGESPHLSRMIEWARVRSGAVAGERVSYFRVRAVRIIEPPPGRTEASARTGREEDE